MAGNAATRLPPSTGGDVMKAAEQCGALPPLPPPDRTMWQYGKQIDHYTAEQMKNYAEACRHADQCNAEGWCSNGCEDRKRKPLTKQELIRMWREPYKNEDHDSWFVEFARAVERAHGITGETK